MLVCFIAATSQSLPRPEFLEDGRKKRELDLLGLLTFTFVMVSFLLLVDLGGQGTMMNTPIMISLVVVFGFSAICFTTVEAFWAKRPMLSPALLRKAGVASHYILQVLLLCAQFSVSALTCWWLVSNIQGS